MRSTERQRASAPAAAGKTPQTPEPSGKTGKSVGTGRTLARYLVMPVFLVAVCVGLYLWVSGLSLDSIEQRSINREVIFGSMIRHLEITGVATLIVVALAVTAGVILTRPVFRGISPYVTAVASTGQALPSIGVLILIAVLFNQVGPSVAVFGLVLYAFLPVMSNTIVGINQVDRPTIESARGMGMTKSAVLFRIELPLAIPIMLAGIRTALIIVVGTATLATFINAGGMGDIINTGIKTARDPILITGSILTAVLALSIDYLAGIAEDVLKPKGL